jgi:hypothetical protein
VEGCSLVGVDNRLAAGREARQPPEPGSGFGSAEDQRNTASCRAALDLSVAAEPDTVLGLDRLGQSRSSTPPEYRAPE